MTAQHHTAQDQDGKYDAEPQTDGIDPIGPITLPKRNKVGARAMALVGTVGMSAFAIAVAATDYSSTWPTIES
ncbi:hypothetical protein EV646_10385 [Kribbella antiqua]|uniref:Uncharacterized protein n=1 Tax=Kribbella antiqua TaxID=2512217 RepID=A0A4R2IVA4_9ACTN|nr:hypothetical protein [Kribbella antiqua]TCO49107.1 hypothetical protein EV646_10385 [Kribbella antiqua]